MLKTWLITGASSGLGLEMTQQLLDKGHRVVATARRVGTLTKLAQEYGGRLDIVELDLVEPRSIDSAVKGSFQRQDRIDVIVSNAGYGLFGAAEELTNEEIDRQIATNLVGSIHLIRAALPHLRRQGGGRIVQVSSEGGQIAYPGFSLYHATKWGIEGFVEAVAQEVAPFGVDFIIAEPGPTGTNFGANLVLAETMDVYDDTPAGAVRRAITDGSFEIKGDAARTVAAIISAAESEKPPLRLALGSTAYSSISQALSTRLSALEAQREVADSADRQDL
ncbi:MULTISPECIES: SDR family oxidoreductase [Agrobacterium]|jgi:NAD(P)-dependent dehydrogenase (short-subunit alcohol dehydrogenase family)|uniref:SDR family oxidoreductase n=1 Tax=Agrobacterium TaxID=357 RepID=UPI000760F1DD|nr:MULTISPECIES: SDR family oxidoreductase [Agrobacterium tumefaciens complex]MCP2138068.1 NAD(P)-dependent dehydrogenase (short-subunit alcohol dehydrogenase family) [Rhizobium sp. SLBN-94]KAB0459094.1 SDR family oxidoreductase [Agrobacterium tumefaciens]KWT79336.1 short-chain dehydrogenase [Agrobacterium radiobacter]MBB4409168.1 NAD(P)-dependent dehydrogenase (short-subunit alcohol dehydrogenase family) [Agrobacterium radiobacter]MBB4454049.1 NAD(P)-dependent dehydrogenase (short-subunit alc